MGFRVVGVGEFSRPAGVWNRGGQDCGHGGRSDKRYRCFRAVDLGCCVKWLGWVGSGRPRWVQ